MAYKINNECIACGSCEPECPTDAISEGEIYEIAGGAGGTTGIFLRKVSLYDTTDFLWKDAKDMTLNILKNSIVIKDGKAAGVPDLRPGDQVRVIKKDNTETGDAYIIIVEN